MASRSAARSAAPSALRSAALSALLPLTLISLLAACGSSATTGNTTVTAVCGTALSASGLGTVASLGITPHALTAADWLAPHVEGEVLVRVPSATSTATQALQTQALGGVQLQSLPGSDFGRATTPGGQSDQAFAATLAASGLSVQPNYIYKPMSFPNDPGYPGNGGVSVGGTSYTQAYLPRINALSGWNTLESACGRVTAAKTAVLDTGADYTHPELSGRLLPGYDFGDGDSDASDNSSDAGHGTGTTGVMAAVGNNGAGIAGLSWSGQTVLPVKVFDKSGDATTATLTAGINYAVAQGARVINMSLGSAGVNDDTALATAIQAAASADVVLVASAGNTAGEGVYYPASDSNVIAVGALGDSDSLACYSARPNSASPRALDLVAPGGNAGTGSPGGCYSFTGTQLLTLTTVANGSYLGDEAGTSFSAPMVAGVASLLRAYRPNLSAAQIRTILIGSAKTVSGGKLLDMGAAVTLAGTY